MKGYEKLIIKAADESAFIVRVFIYNLTKFTVLFSHFIENFDYSFN